MINRRRKEGFTDFMNPHVYIKSMRENKIKIDNIENNEKDI